MKKSPFTSRGIIDIKEILCKPGETPQVIRHYVDSKDRFVCSYSGNKVNEQKEKMKLENLEKLKLKLKKKYKQ